MRIARTGFLVVAAVVVGLGCGRAGRERGTSSGGEGGDTSSSSAGEGGGGAGGAGGATSSSSSSAGGGGATSSSSSGATGGGGATSSSSSSSTTSSSGTGGGCQGPADCPATECEDATCASGVCGLVDKAIGTACSSGLCQAGACVAHIPVVCKTANGTYKGCDGMQHNADIFWDIQTGPGMLESHMCQGIDTMKADYCPPGTDCAVSAPPGSQMVFGKCQ